MNGAGKFVGNQEVPELLKVKIYELPKLQRPVYFIVGERERGLRPIPTTNEFEVEGDNKEPSIKQKNTFHDTSMGHVKEQISNKIPKPPPLPSQPQCGSQSSTIKFSKNPHKKIETLKTDFFDELKERLSKLKINDN